MSFSSFSMERLLLGDVGLIGLELNEKEKAARTAAAAAASNLGDDDAPQPGDRSRRDPHAACITWSGMVLLEKSGSVIGTLTTYSFRVTCLLIDCYLTSFECWL
jgi:hypothetical protein